MATTLDEEWSYTWEMLRRELNPDQPAILNAGGIDYAKATEKALEDLRENCRVGCLAVGYVRHAIECAIKATQARERR